MQALAKPATLVLRGLKKTLARGDERFELRAPEIELVAGEVAAIVGESGAGKSTLLDILALISPPDEAESFTVTRAGAEPADVQELWRSGDEAALSALRRSVGLVLQSGGLLGFLNVAGNAALARRLAGRPRDRAGIARIAGELGVAEKLRSYPATLSGGERQRAAILRALAHEPQLLVADEPTAAVDRTRAEAIMDELARQAERRGAACVIVSHDLALVEKIAHRVYRIEVERDEDGASRALCSRVEGASARAPVAPPVAETPVRRAAGGVGRHLLPARLAATDLRHDARFSLASIAAIAAVIAPLLLLLGLKQGVVEHEIERLLQDPRSRELTPMRAVELTPETLERWRALPEVAFLAPGIARGASGVVARVIDRQRGATHERLMDLLATQPGDPLLEENGAPDPKAGEVALSHAAAVHLARGEEPGVMVGRPVDLVVSRRFGGRRELQRVSVKVVGVLDPRADPLERIYAPFGFVASVERFRSGEREDLASDGAEADQKRFRGFRLYARSIYDVERLHRRLSEEGVEAAAQLGPIRAVREVDLALSTLLALVGAIGLGGAFSAMAANLVSMVERKRAEIGLLRMLGLSRRGAFALPMISAVLIAGLAAGLACGVYAAAATPINLYLAEVLPFGDRITRLYPSDMAIAVAIACMAAALCAVFAARRAARVDPATALRRE